MRTVFLTPLLILGLISCLGRRPEPEIYLIQNNYRGKVNVIFSQLKGQEIIYEGDKRVYKIPENGILLTKAKPEYGFVKHEYYFVDSLGNRTPINILFDNHQNQKEIGIYRDGTVGAYGNSNDKQSLKFQEFYVADQESLDKYFSIQYNNDFFKAVKQVTGIDF
ncbi:hypothetical protein ODZ84_09825 [Chryseobacterium fluminis]|uniref:DUF6843 domain-containing protein n=1 Tax=Chryseobacterium fluminis TaxID=2983606 RepID=UPI002259B538|nr:hypothetical protein [Chryseobacterium sp. MMS21-Ot14]UZT99832.1 hypothetical protein ODZ84_09825 [Chryseobacterium sp. MMS21-Ot14]